MNADPYLKPAFSLRNRAARAVWNVAWALLFRPSPRIFFAWRRGLLRAFGARIAPHCNIYPKARIWAPWNLRCDEAATIADEVVVYNPAPIVLGSHAIVSQQAYLCGASHDVDDPAFPLVAAPITLGAYSWVAARATVLPGVALGDYAVLALGSVATRDLDAGGIYVGVPARHVRQRRVAADSQDRTGQGTR
jgi:putative colanic acid biosynthesis acetyltransferase WcaF